MYTTMCAVVTMLPYLDFRNVISYQDLSLLSRCTILQVHIELTNALRVRPKPLN